MSRPCPLTCPPRCPPRQRPSAGLRPASGGLVPWGRWKPEGPQIRSAAQATPTDSQVGHAVTRPPRITRISADTVRLRLLAEVIQIPSECLAQDPAFTDTSASRHEPDTLSI